MNRIGRLAEPRHRPPYSDHEGNAISRSTLRYVATERIISLSQPKREVDIQIIYKIPRTQFPENPDYVNVKSHGTEKLARPRHPRQKYLKVNVDVRCSYTPVKPSALRYDPTVRLRKLAQPREVEEEELKDAYKVSKKALKKPSKKQEATFKAMSTPIERMVTPKYESA